MKLVQSSAILISLVLAILYWKQPAIASNKKEVTHSPQPVAFKKASPWESEEDQYSFEKQLARINQVLPAKLEFPEITPTPLQIVENFEPKLSAKATALLKDGPIKGFTLGLQSKDYNYDYEMLLKEIKATGSPWVCLTFSVYQEENNSTTIDFLPAGSPFWQQIERTAAQAKALGLKVVIFPIVLLKKPGFRQWRGSLRPMSYDGWYQSYDEFMTIVAQLAARTKADMLSIGSEFSSLDRAELRWYKVIEHIKKHYQGALMYSANWDTLFNIQFQDQLDFLGVTGYFNLTKKKDPSISELVAAWKPIKKSLKEWQKKKNIPLLFSELGYTSQDGTNMHPWNYTIPNILDLQEQKDCYTAFTKVWKDDPTMYGLFFYEWFGVGGAQDFGYTPRGKPALEVAKEWF